ncbi:MAG: OmpA/MotB family protein, partial [Planctomycetota bacterium]
TLAGELSQERARRAEAIAELESARAEAALLAAENETLKNRPPEVVEVAVQDTSVSDTVNDLQNRGIDAIETPDGNIAIVLPSDITFGSGSKDLTRQGKKSLTSIAAELNGQFAGQSVRIEGHTDTDPIRRSKFKDNWELGSERALSVLRYLSTSHGIAPERLSAATRGQTMPVADNKSKAGKIRNRRVEIVVIVPKGAAAAK